MRGLCLFLIIAIGVSSLTPSQMKTVGDNAWALLSRSCNATLPAGVVFAGESATYGDLLAWSANVLDLKRQGGTELFNVCGNSAEAATVLKALSNITKLENKTQDENPINDHFGPCAADSFKTFHDLAISTPDTNLALLANGFADQSLLYALSAGRVFNIRQSINGFCQNLGRGELDLYVQSGLENYKLGYTLNKTDVKITEVNQSKGMATTAYRGIVRNFGKFMVPNEQYAVDLALCMEKEDSNLDLTATFAGAPSCLGNISQVPLIKANATDLAILSKLVAWSVLEVLNKASAPTLKPTLPAAYPDGYNPLFAVANNVTPKGKAAAIVRRRNDTSSQVYESFTDCKEASESCKGLPVATKGWGLGLLRKNRS